MNLSKQLKGKINRKRRTEPLWQGPESDGPQGGVTQSLLGRFLSCRERFRLKVVEGLQANEGFNPRLEYGNMWHVCEEELASGDEWERGLRKYAADLCKKYPLDQEKIEHWYNLCKAFFPLYVEHWAEHPDVKDRTPLLQEESFKVPYKLPSGRTVYLRGKWDAVDLIGKGKTAGVYIQENKTKSSVDVTKLMRQLKFDLQTMTYLVALQAEKTVHESLPGWEEGHKLLGVRFNVIRRPAHKTVESALKKFHEDKKAGRIGEWFARFKCEITPQDVAKFRHECLDPILENISDDYEWWSYCYLNAEDVYNGEHRKNAFRNHCSRHYRFPFGVWNITAEGGFSDVDSYLETGSEVGLKRIDNLFPEL